MYKKLNYKGYFVEILGCMKLYRASAIVNGSRQVNVYRIEREGNNPDDLLNEIKNVIDVYNKEVKKCTQDNK
jgi:hypothetical protein